MEFSPLDFSSDYVESKRATTYKEMSSEVSYRDDHSFRSYRARECLGRQEVQYFQENHQKRILRAVVQDDVDELKKLLVSPKWFRIVDGNGLSLLHISILENSKQTFDHLLFLPAFPLEIISDYGETALITSILVIEGKPGDDYFAWRLIEAGADIFYCDNFNDTTLSCAALRHHVKMAAHFIQNGVDVNRRNVYGDTALHHAADHDGPDCLELVSLLLENGADAGILNEDGLVAFEKAVFQCRCSLLQEVLFYYTYDGYSEMKTHFSVLVRLARCRSPLLMFFDDANVDDPYVELFDIDLEYLEILITRFKCAIADVLPMCSLREWSPNVVTFEKLELFIESDLRMDLISCIQNQKYDLLFQYLIEEDFDEATISNVTCYFLSYGVELTESGLQRIYQKFGCCEFFKILLHMDIQMQKEFKTRHVMPAFLYDINLTLENYLRNSDQFSTENVHHLLDYFVNTRLNEACNLYGDKISSRVKNLPQVPLLVELARNRFRKYFIQTFQIKNSRQFYTLINHLNVGNVYKKILTFEKMLY